MQAGRELDKKIAEAIGLQEILPDTWIRNGVPSNLPKFSTTGDGMLILIDEARKQGIWLDHETFADGYEVSACVYRSKHSRTVLADSMFRSEDLAGEYARVYIKAKEAI
ncbi:hypothetical protein ABH14_16980 [Brevibacillus brevis]|uniref:hypothetical protein n=1 Tax=Brevibacillus brevis TaxID=1393 RepID=UPI001900088A|nr:hypothetical protein [Brevibacillus brevis]MBH0331469.1 hypothetical protein [Brevibacillus brevis]